ncbi:ECF transporter S component [Sinomonas sp. ASV322]|uniref:ECF transporter S component n=1 Tax=Sinomonas sp. ASV322 TaxID=3041920 RepID=UPI0027DAECAA|nr:ECF transporter S component [Sinomonas sp. ASV322]MDQ4502575.1 ECF transporter S component [Sinomonas sp. ASV322]
MSTTTKPVYTWRVVDIVVAAVVSVACGVIFWLWDQAYTGVLAVTAAFAPLSGLYSGGWLLAGVLGGFIIRKPGAALFCEILAAVVEALLGSQFGVTVLLSGLVQGLGAELGFAIFAYRRWNVAVALLAGALSGLALGVSEVIQFFVEWEFGWKVAYTVFAVISGIVIAGLLSWLAVKALAKTGALSAFAAGRAADV